MTALEEIGFCLAHVGPENGSIYADVLALYAELSCRIGEFSVAREACMQRLAYEKFIHNCTGAVGAMIAFGDILRTLGEYADAQRYLLKAVELSEEIEDKALRAVFGRLVATCWLLRSGWPRTPVHTKSHSPY